MTGESHALIIEIEYCTYYSSPYHFLQSHYCVLIDNAKGHRLSNSTCDLLLTTIDKNDTVSQGFKRFHLKRKP